LTSAWNGAHVLYWIILLSPASVIILIECLSPIYAQLKSSYGQAVVPHICVPMSFLCYRRANEVEVVLSTVLFSMQSQTQLLNLILILLCLGLRDEASASLLAPFGIKARENRSLRNGWQLYFLLWKQTNIMVFTAKSVSPQTNGALRRVTWFHYVSNSNRSSLQQNEFY